MFRGGGARGRGKAQKNHGSKNVTPTCQHIIRGQNRVFRGGGVLGKRFFRGGRVRGGSFRKGVFRGRGWGKRKSRRNPLE